MTQLSARETATVLASLRFFQQELVRDEVKGGDVGSPAHPEHGLQGKRLVLVANPRLFEPDCQSPFQMQLANALCRYREMSSEAGS